MVADRLFKFWDFNVSHKRLLIRSPKDEEHDDNIDLIFWGVEYLETPTTFENLRLVDADNDEVAKVCQILSKAVEPDEVHVLCSGKRRFLICAIAKKLVKNKLDIFESSLDTPVGSDE